jgi:hypothetical protein
MGTGRARLSSRAVADSQWHSSARNLGHSLVFPFRRVRLHKAFRHPLDSVVLVQFIPPPSNGIKLEHTVLHGTMPAFANVANLNARIGPVTRNSPSSKPHRVPRSLLRQARTFLRIAKIAELPQFLLRRNLALMSGGGASPAPSASQRKPSRVQPCAILHLLHRHKKGTRHLHPPAIGIIKDCSFYSSHRRKPMPNLLKRCPGIVVRSRMRRSCLNGTS